ncbi:MAG: Na+/H+ antiporter NhaA [Coriobacteriales bacterium]|nr:Na+/H+ antiporter NhaA [Coriobacteriales bacterium]
MIAAAVVAVIVANSPFALAYAEFWEMPVGITVGSYQFSESLLRWINDGLMALFFLVVGLEIKREFIVGELSQPRKAALPVLAALGGMAVPALIYVAVTIRGGTALAAGWGVPMATDIAFALGVLAVLGSRVPAGLKVFLTALAIADDVGAILVIALFYTTLISWSWLLIAAATFAALLVMNRLGVDGPGWYLLVGALLWFAMLNSGVHATIAGVLLAVAVPATARITPPEFTEFASGRLATLEANHTPGEHVLENDAELQCAVAVCGAARRTAAPLQRLEFGLNPVATYVALPLFALANAGVAFVGWDRFAADPSALLVAVGIAAGLAVGKPVGILAASWLALRSGLAELPKGCNWTQLAGIGILGGIGFTVALFIATLAFAEPSLLSAAKVAILGTSVVMGALGYVVVRLSCPGSDEGLS